MTCTTVKNYKLANFSIFKLASLFLLLLTLTACGGGGGGNDGGSTLSGTAATGAAIIGKVSIYGDNGGVVADVQTDSSGKYSADVSGLTPPFCVCVVPDDSSKEAQYSYAKGAGTANITPLTTLTLYYANGGQDPAQLADASAWPTASQTVVAGVPNAQAAVNANFTSLLSAQGFNSSSYDFFTSQFVPGDQFDQILDQLGINFTGGVPIITVDGSTFTFDPNIEIITGGSSGTVTFTGAGSNLLDTQGKIFDPSGVADLGLIGFTFFEGPDGGDGDFITITTDLNNKVTSVIMLLQGRFLWGATEDDIPNVSYDGVTITFTNLVVIDDVEGSGNPPLTLNGSLSK